MTEIERLQREKDGYKTDLDRIALVVYPDKQEWFTYSVDFVIEEIKKLRADRDAWEACVREAAASKSPCGHSAQYAYTPDGKGKVILCYACKLAAAEADTRRLDDWERMHLQYDFRPGFNQFTKKWEYGGGHNYRYSGTFREVMDAVEDAKTEVKA